MFICKKYGDCHSVFEGQGHNSRIEQVFCIFLNLAYVSPMQHCVSKCEKTVTVKSLTVAQQDSRNELVEKGWLVTFHSSEHAKDHKKWNKTLSLCLLFSFPICWNQQNIQYVKIHIFIHLWTFYEIYCNNSTRSQRQICKQLSAKG